MTATANKDTAYTVAPPDIHKVEYYDGRIGSGTVIKTVATDYTLLNQISVPIRETTTWNQPNLVSKTETDWETMAVPGGTFTWKNPAEQRVYDWGTSAPGALLRRTHSAYRHLESDGQNYLAANIADLPTLVQTFDGAGNLLAQSKNSYDGGTLTNTNTSGSCSSPSIPGHDYCNHSTVNTTRGNVTTSGHWLASHE